MFPTETRTRPQTVLAALPHRGAYQKIGPAFEQAARKIADAGLSDRSGPPIGIYYDDPSEVPVEELRSHAGQTIDADATIPPGMDRVVLPEGRYLVLTCKGPYAKLPEAWAYLYAQAVPDGGHVLRHGLPFEVYVTDPYRTRPEDFVTEVWVPIV